MTASAHMKIVAAVAETSTPGLAKTRTEQADKLRELQRSGRVSFGQLAFAWKKPNGQPITWERARAIVRRPNGPDSERIQALPAPIRAALGVTK